MNGVFFLELFEVELDNVSTVKRNVELMLILLHARDYSQVILEMAALFVPKQQN